MAKSGSKRASVRREASRTARGTGAVTDRARHDADPDCIVCMLCGREFRAITPMHLRAAHGFRGPHPVAEYKRRFGLRVAVCADTQDALKDSRRRQLRRDPDRHDWSKAKLGRELRRRARADESLAPGDVDLSIYAAARRAFGSWDAALEAAGLDPSTHRRARSWTRTSVLEAIREHAGSGDPHALSAMARRDPALLSAAQRRFGDWDTAVLAAGCQDQLQPASRRRWTWAEARDWVMRRVERGRPFTHAHVPAGLLDRVRCDTGEGWGLFVESLGITYPNRPRRSRWTDKKVQTLLGNRWRAGLSMAAGDVRKQAPTLHAEARGRFGSWHAALVAAGVDMKRHGQAALALRRKRRPRHK